MKKEQPTGYRIADYAWLSENSRSWVLWAGNPFCISRYTFPKKTRTKECLIKIVKKEQAKEYKRFTKLFAEVKWNP